MSFFSVELTVFGDPKGQPRPKAFVRNGRAAVYDPGTAEHWKSQIALAVREAKADGKNIDFPVHVSITCFFRRPKSHYRTGKNAHLLKPSAPQYHTSKPDFDNVAKAVCDALTHLSLWRDDSQVVSAKITKLYADSEPYTYIIVREVGTL